MKEIQPVLAPSILPSNKRTSIHNKTKDPIFSVKIMFSPGIDPTLLIENMAARLICRFLPILRLNKMQSQISPRFRVLRHLSNTISQSQSTSMRSILCGLVRQDAVGKEVVISGWLQVSAKQKQNKRFKI